MRVYTKKAANYFVKNKDIKSLIILWEREKAANQVACCDFELQRLNDRQKEVLKEQVKTGKKFGLDNDAFDRVTDFLGLRESPECEYPF